MELNPHPWQREVNEILKEKAPARLINWVVDLTRGVGKSLYVKNHSVKHKYESLDWIDSRDVLHARSQNMNSEVVFFI